jgi:sucrose phosphorylase
LGGDLGALGALLERHLGDVFTGIHILPPFPSTADRGFAPTTYREIEPAFGTWDDVRAIGARFDVLIDLMVNHISRRSPEFQDFQARGRESPHADLFITLDKVWPHGEPQPEDVAKIFLRRPKPPFSAITVQKTGTTEHIWTTFGRTEPTEQIDLDVHSPLTRTMLVDHLRFFRQQQMSAVRLDAVGYVIKKPGTSCFMVEPEIYAFMDWLMGEAAALGLTLLPEVHSEPHIQRALAAHGYWIYDFVLPLLVLHTLLTRSGAQLSGYLRKCPARQFTTLDTHDGIPVQPDVIGVLTTSEMEALVNRCVAQGANVSRLMTPTGEPKKGFDAHQVNITYYSALGAQDSAYLIARALQLFAPGIPQIYYVGLLAGENDAAAVAATGEGRAINRRNYTSAEVEAALRRPVVQRMLRLIRLRNSHPAFGGKLRVHDGPPDQVHLEWRRDDDFAELRVDLRATRADMRWTEPSGRVSSDRIDDSDAG